MANKSKSVGTEFENRVLGYFRALGLEGRRLKDNSPSWDLLLDDLPDLPIEAKRHATWKIPEWLRGLETWHRGKPWALAVAHRDLRRADVPPPIMVLPLKFGVELIALYAKEKNRDDRQAL